MKVRVYVQLCKTREFGKSGEVGRHLKKPNADELADAIMSADRNNQVVFVYDSSRTLNDLAEMVTQGLGLIVGWSNYCQSMPAFVVDEHCLDITELVAVNK